MKELVILGIFSLGLWACQRVQEVATPIPSPQMAEVSGKSYQRLKQGHGVYMRHCAQCHEHRLPLSGSLPEWHDKVSSMSALAGISRDDEHSLQVYLDEFTDR
ncbi:MAG: hypothetical protein ACON4K_08470 [Akkermansiaceae bacterium]